MNATWKFEIGQRVDHFGVKSVIVSRDVSAFGKPTYEIEKYYMGNLNRVSVWQDELKAL